MTTATPDHPGSTLLERFVLADTDPEATAAVEAHLRDGCLLCLVEVQEVFRAIRLRDPEPLGEPPPERLEDRLRRMSARVRHHQIRIEAERRIAPWLRERLRVLTRPQQREAVKGKGAFKLFGLAELLAEEARSEAHRDVNRALEVAELAMVVADAVDPAAYAPGQVADATVAAWAALGNALRVRADLAGAERALGVARNQLALGAGDPMTRADLLSLIASLRLDQARFPEAREALDEATILFQQVGDRPGEGKSLIQLAEVAAETGEPERAVGLLEAAEALLDPAANRHLYLTAKHSRAARLVDARRAWEAMALFRSFQRAFLDAMPPSKTRRLPWLLGWIHEGMDQPEQAAELFERVRRSFQAEEEHFDFVVATLDLVRVRLKQGMTGEVQGLVEELLPVISTCELPKEAMKALMYFQRAALTERLTDSAVREVSSFLQRARRNPDLPYPGAVR
ncbi:MAG: tetratricopeptide repeat protein [Thermoanaerobaculia bacterium]